MQGNLFYGKHLCFLIALFLIPASAISQSGSNASGDYEVGELTRPMSGFSWSGGNTFQHHDVLVRHHSSHTRRGFFATSMIAAAQGADLWYDYP